MGAAFWVRSILSWRARVIPYAKLTPGLASNHHTQLPDYTVPVAWTSDGLWLLRDAGYPFPDRRTGFRAYKIWPQPEITVRWPVSFANRRMLEVHGDRLLLEQNGATMVWRVPHPRKLIQAQETFRAPGKPVRRPWRPGTAALSPDGSRIAVASDTHNVFFASHTYDGVLARFGVALFDGRTGRQIARIAGTEGNVTALAFSPDNARLAATTADGFVLLINAQTGRLERRWRAHPWFAACIAWTPDSRRMVTGAKSSLRNVFFQYGPGGEVSVPNGPGIRGTKVGGKVRRIARDFAGLLRVDGQTYADLRLWDAATGHALWTSWSAGGDIQDVVFDGSGEHLAVATASGVFLFPMTGTPAAWPRPDRLDTASLIQPNPTGHFVETRLAFSPDGNQLAASFLDDVVIWRTR
jgi:WD40 repeat protein